MKRIRRIFIILTALSLTVLLAAGSALATPIWKDNKGIKDFNKAAKARSKMHFKDISGHWAEQNIVLINAEDVIKGYEDYTFQPNKPVTKEEAITMIVRMAASISGDTLISGKNKNLNGVSAWARSFLGLAVEKGILSEVELNTIDFKKPAQRYEVAIWLVRALGLENEAIDNAGADLDFRDEAAVPAWARGYVKVATDEGIIVGFPGNVFRPGVPVTRAEMATMLVKAREGFEIPSPRQGFSFVRGVVEEVYSGSNPYITFMRLGGSYGREVSVLTLKVADEAYIYLDGKSAELEDLEERDSVAVLLDVNREAVVIIARSHSSSDGNDDEDVIDNEVIDGIVESVGSSSITVKVDGHLKVYTLDDDVDVIINGQEADLDDLEKGFDVKLTIEENEVEKIKASGVIVDIE
jgi:hypothetical protein